MFQNAANSTMNHCNFTNVNGDIHNYNSFNNNKPVLEVLYENAAPGAFHISNERYDPPKCHEDTRVAIRQDLLSQVTTAVVSCIIWLYGAAGVGKSAIAQSFAEMCEEEELLIGTFFFSRGVPWRHNAQRLAASLAYQLARSIPSTLEYVALCVTTHPAIFSSSLEDQIEQLFVQPFFRACSENPTCKPKPRLVILDGLDECDMPDVQRNILVVLEKALAATPIPIIVLIASRPEVHISSTFELIDHRSSIQTFHFGLNDNDNVDEDIHLYLSDKLKVIKRDHPFRKYLPDSWPLSKDIDSIVEKSSGQFIYAATIIRYLGHHQCKPHDRLQTVLESSERFGLNVLDSPFKELDALYFQIFHGVGDVAVVLAILALALGVEGIHTQWPQTIAVRLGLGPGDVEMHISKLASLMKYEGEKSPIRFFHASLRDFLVDEHRSQSLCINQPAVRTTICKAYLDRIVTTENVVCFETLQACNHHLLSGPLDASLSDMIAEVGSKIPNFIKSFRLCQRTAKWNDDGVHTSRSPHFNELVTVADDLKDIMQRHNPAYWDQCINAMHSVFHEELSVYLTDETAHDLLAVVAFKRDNDEVALRGYNKFPPRLFTLSLGMSTSTWDVCREADIIASKDRWLCVSKTLQSFLLDPYFSGKLSIAPKRFAQVALKCLNATMLTRLSGNISADTCEPEEISYLWSLRSMTQLLPRAPKCRQLIDALRLCDGDFHWLTQFPNDAEAAKQATRSYLESHTSNYPRKWSKSLLKGIGWLVNAKPATVKHTQTPDSEEEHR